ncbi:hypothetical protein [Rhodoferax sp.]|uniref:hypothetical protein n=1 Tax=Rhodoferax sp. TaxID=50421 RepID=UPI00374C98BF
MGFLPMEEGVVVKSPDFTPTRRASGFSGHLHRFKTSQGFSLGLGFAPRISSRKTTCAIPNNLRSSSQVAAL